MPRNPNSEPWWNWSDRWQIVDDYMQGVSFNKLGIKYHHDRGQIAQWIDSLGLRLEQFKSLPKPQRTPRPKRVAKTKPIRRSSNIHELCLALVYAEEKLGRPPRWAEIERVMWLLSQEGTFFATRAAIAAD